MSYDDEETLEELKKHNTKLLKHLVNDTGNAAVQGSAILKEVANDNKIIDNIDINMRIADANLKKAKYVEENYTTMWGWVKSWFKSKPKDADLSDIDNRNSDIKIREANKNYEEAKDQFARNQDIINNTSDKDFKNTAYDLINANIDRLKNNAVGIGEELDNQNKNFENQDYYKSKRIKY